MEHTTTVLIVLLNGEDVVYRLETPAECTTDMWGVYVEIGQHMRTLDEKITFDRIEVQARHRRRDV